MPCFDPRDVLFLTNQWDIIGTDSSSSDDGDCKSEEEKAETWNTIKNKIEESWFCFDVTNVFRVSLQPVSIFYYLLRFDPFSSKPFYDVSVI